MGKELVFDKELALLDKRIKALEAGQRKLVSILRLAFPAPTEIELEAFLQHCGSNGILVIDEWNKRKKIEDVVTKIE